MNYSPFGQQPFGYQQDMSMPNSMMPSPASTLPPVFPNTQTNQVFPSEPFPPQNSMRPQYAEGGPVMPMGGGLTQAMDGGMQGMGDMDPMQEGMEGQGDLQGIAEFLRQQGQGEDTILAHINAEEAMELHEKYGSDINPMTGLPQFGKLRKILKKAAPIIGSIGGFLMGGPAGAAVGGGLGGALSNKRSPLKAALKGASLGYLGASGLAGMGVTGGAGFTGLGATLGSAGRALAANPLGAIGTGASNFAGGVGTGVTNAFSSVGNMLGGGAAPASAASTVAGAAGAAPAAAGAAGGAGGMMGSIGSILGSKGMSNALLAAAIGGTMLRKEKPNKNFNPNHVSDQMQQQPVWNPQQQASPSVANAPYYIPPAGGVGNDIYMPPEGYRHGYDPEFNYFSQPVRARTGGGFRGSSGGQADDIDAKVSPGEFMIPADVVSAAGDGNTERGFKQFYGLVSQLRKDNGRKNKLPPKAKSLSTYLNAA